MSGASIHFAFIGPGGPEFLLIMLILLMMFGAKDAPRILRKLNEIINQIRNTADGFKREVMYSDLSDDTPSSDDNLSGTDEELDEDQRDEDAVQDEAEPGPADSPEEEGDAEKA
jgi:Sec-independent protein translocase protein TatA